MRKVPISEASDEQVIWFAKNVQALANVPAKRDKILAALLQSGWDDDFILVHDDAPAEPSSTVPDVGFYEQALEPEEQVCKMPASGFGYWRDSPMVRCKIMPTDRPGGNEPAHPSINGSPCLVIQRNRLVEIPYDFYLVLKQAGGTKVTAGEKVTDELVRTDYYEYPMTDVVLPPRSEIAAWQQRFDPELGAKAKVAA